ncbi:SPOR domain-containing protein [Halalkalibacter sp. APA_J-10(15)]|uniref:SPOR domain-containing protein n=1 Tax=Halalkalibacter sp. APA_J-10(15) TaxID=2933805 RepID=UPI001FF13D61|nr:hypothetical protein [Halalkalibacter sp. APA_J-10(15)]MCK0473539.1 hypothetical protein [Halalkalibacter sp. APA_J-10(15)]
MEQKKRSISVRLNGKERHVQERTVAATNEKEDNQYAFIPPPDNVIDFGEKQEVRQRNEQPYWDDGNREKSPKIPYKRKKKPHSQSQTFPYMLVAALGSAIIVGVSLGLVILNMFTGNDMNVSQMSEQSTGAVPTFSEEKEGMPNLAIEVVQGAAFTELDQAEKSVQSIQEQGFAATITTSTDPIYMFIGVAGDRAQATKINEIYEGYGQDTYLKSYRVEGDHITGQAQEVYEWFTNALTLYYDMVQLSIDGLNGGTMITNERIEQLSASIDSLQEERNQAFAQLNEEVQPLALTIGDQLITAKDHLKDFTNAADEEKLWKGQQTLLESITTYEELIQAMR